MPLYEYRCQECDHLEEVLQKSTDPAPVTCPACGKEHTLAKEVSLTSFQLKGGGWYKDLYSSTPKDGGKKDGAGAAKGESKSGDAKSDKKSESKKSETKKTETQKSSGSKATKAA